MWRSVARQGFSKVLRDFAFSTRWTTQRTEGPHFKTVYHTEPHSHSWWIWLYSISVSFAVYFLFFNISLVISGWLQRVWTTSSTTFGTSLTKHKCNCSTSMPRRHLMNIWVRFFFLLQILLPSRRRHLFQRSRFQFNFQGEDNYGKFCRLLQIRSCKTDFEKQKSSPCKCCNVRAVRYPRILSLKPSVLLHQPMGNERKVATETNIFPILSEFA